MEKWGVSISLVCVFLAAGGVSCAQDAIEVKTQPIVSPPPQAAAEVVSPVPVNDELTEALTPFVDLDLVIAKQETLVSTLAFPSDPVKRTRFTEHYFRLIGLYLLNRDIEKARVMLASLADQYPDAAVGRKAKNLATAIAPVEVQGLGDTFFSTLSIFHMGELLYDLGQYDDALTFFQKAVKKEISDEEQFDLLLVVGRCKVELGRWEEAVSDYQEALALAQKLDYGDDWNSYLASAIEALTNSATQEASLANCQQFAENFYGALSFHDGKRNQYQRCLQLPGSSGEYRTLYEKLAESYRGVDDELFLYWNARIIEDYPQDKEACARSLLSRARYYYERYEYGNPLLKAKHLNQALDYFKVIEKGYEGTPAFFEALFAIGTIYKEKKGYTAAVDTFRRLLVAATGGGAAHQQEYAEYAHRAAVEAALVYEALENYRKAYYYIRLARDTYPLQSDCAACRVRERERVAGIVTRIKKNLPFVFE